MDCTCPPVDDCTGSGSSACALAAQHRKAPETMEAPVCRDMDATGNVVLGPDGGALCVVHEPIDPCGYRSSMAVRLQKTVDNARRKAHELGFRPYRVFMVWTRRNRRQVFEEFRRKELVPVRVSQLSDVDRELRAVGLDEAGGLRISRISPNQTTDYELQGRITQGAPLAEGEEFFYEVVRNARYPGETPERARFTPASLPNYNAKRFQWSLELRVQSSPRSPQGADQTLQPATPGRKNRLELLKR